MHTHNGILGTDVAIRTAALLILCLLSLPAVGGEIGLEVVAAKIRFDLSVLDDSGLYGPADGLRALDYEFCIPETGPIRWRACAA